MPAYPSADGAAKDQKYQSYACGQHPVSVSGGDWNKKDKISNTDKHNTDVKLTNNNKRQQKITMSLRYNIVT